MMITAAQLRAARGLLDWTRSELAKASGLSAETIKNIEHGVYAPQESTIAAIVNAFSDHDVELTDNNGVQLAKSVVQTYIGNEGFRRFNDDFYNVVASTDTPACINGVNDELFTKALGDYAQIHFARMAKLNGKRIRAMAREGDSFFPATSYIDYRWLPSGMVGTVPFCVYGDKLGIIIFSEKEPRVVVIKSKIVSQAYYEQFDALWKLSRDPIINNKVAS